MKKIIGLIFSAVLIVSLTACSGNEVKNTINEKNKQTIEDTGDQERQVDIPIEFENLPEEFLAGNFEGVYKQTSEGFKEMVSIKQFTSLGESFNHDVKSYILLSQMPFQGLIEYLWISDNNDKGIRALVNSDQIIEGLLLQPLSKFPDQDERFTENTYQLPFSDEWFVLWGGTNELVNYHYAYENQRYAYDFLIMKDDKSFEGDASVNENYFAFGKEVLAPLDGTVVSVENNLEDNTPGVTTNTEQLLGNHVIIQHKNNEYSVIAHLQKGSVTVNVGDTVNTGDVLGLVGNSGNSSEPHIHFHISDSENWEQATSFRIKFADDLNPVRGDFITGNELNESN